jgi:hypothetical protein
MNGPSGVATVTGDAFFGNVDMGDTELTAGLLDIRGDLAASPATPGFRAAGSHTTRLSGTAAQTVDFFVPGQAASRFMNLEITNASVGGVTITSSIHVEGALVQNGRLLVPTPRALTIVGALTLGTGSITNVTGTITFGGCTNLGGTATGFTC